MNRSGISLPVQLSPGKNGGLGLECPRILKFPFIHSGDLMKSLRSAITAGALALGFALAGTATAETLVPLPQPTPMPSFKIAGINGSNGSDADLRNKVTIIRFWASW